MEIVLGTRTNKLNKNDWILFLLFFCIYGLISIFLSSHFFPLTEGWFSESAMYILDGQIMYKDFAMYIPPIFPMIVAGIIKIFGYSFMVLRIYGILERLILCLFVFLLLRKFFNTNISFLALIVSSVFYITNAQDLFYGYYQTSLLLAVVCFYFYYSSLNANGNKSKNCYAYFSGVFLGLLLFCKHVTGIVIFFCIIVVSLFLCILKKDKNFAKILLFNILGFLTVCLPIILIMVANDAFIPMLNQLFGGLGAKGTVLDVLFNFVTKNFAPFTVFFVLFFLFPLISLTFKPKSNKGKLCISILTITYYLFVLIFSLIFILSSGLESNIGVTLCYILFIVLFSIPLFFVFVNYKNMLKNNFSISFLSVLAFVFLFACVLMFPQLEIALSLQNLFSNIISGGLFWAQLVVLIYLLVCFFKKRDAFGGAIEYNSIFNFFLKNNILCVSALLIIIAKQIDNCN